MTRERGVRCQSVVRYYLDRTDLRSSCSRALRYLCFNECSQLWTAGAWCCCPGALLRLSSVSPPSLLRLQLIPCCRQMRRLARVQGEQEGGLLKVPHASRGGNEGESEEQQMRTMPRPFQTSSPTPHSLAVGCVKICGFLGYGRTHAHAKRLRVCRPSFRAM